MFEKVDRTPFEQEFETQVYSRDGGVDPFEEQKYNELKQIRELEFFTGFIEESDIERLVLPQHDGKVEHGKTPDRVVKVGGESFKKVIIDFLINYIPNQRFPKTVNKVLKLKELFFQGHQQRFDANFIYISNDREIAHDLTHYDSSHGYDKLYIGNGFHRFVAYGMSIEEYGFRPLNVYLVKKLKSARNP